MNEQKPHLKEQLAALCLFQCSPSRKLLANAGIYELLKHCKFTSRHAPVQPVRCRMQRGHLKECKRLISPVAENSAGLSTDSTRKIPEIV